jgi:pimeloyl-ACP methyl ester carboxylesterase
MAAPLLLVPGLMCDARVWRDVLPALQARRDCIVLRVHGPSSLGAMAERLLAQAPPRFALAGHSMGGRIALEVLRRAPQRVERLALLDTGWQGMPAGVAANEERRHRLALLDIAWRKGMRAMAQAWAPGMVLPARHGDAVFEDVLTMVARHTPQDFERQIHALMARPDAADVLASIDVPTLVLCGRQDDWSPLARHESMADRIRGARLAVVEDCGHMSPMERPAEVARALVDWLDP